MSGHCNDCRNGLYSGVSSSASWNESPTLLFPLISSMLMFTSLLRGHSIRLVNKIFVDRYTKARKTL